MSRRYQGIWCQTPAQDNSDWADLVVPMPFTPRVYGALKAEPRSVQLASLMGAGASWYMLGRIIMDMYVISVIGTCKRPDIALQVYRGGGLKNYLPWWPRHDFPLQRAGVRQLIRQCRLSKLGLRKSLINLNILQTWGRRWEDRKIQLKHSGRVLMSLSATVRNFTMHRVPMSDLGYKVFTLARDSAKATKLWYDGWLLYINGWAYILQRHWRMRTPGHRDVGTTCTVLHSYYTEWRWSFGCCGSWKNDRIYLKW